MGKGKGKLIFEHYSYRIEFQIRGLPHLHGALWLSRKYLDTWIGKDVTLQESKKYEEIIDKIVKKLITCEIPEIPQNKEEISDEDDEKKKEREDFIKKQNDLKDKVLKLQVHRHTKTCEKHGTKCRFGFPRYPSNKTLISVPPEERPEFKDLDKEEKEKLLEKYKNTLEKVKNALEDKELDDNLTLEEFLETLKIELNDYEKALQTSERGRVLVLERTLKERYVNNYNPEWLTAWVSE